MGQVWTHNGVQSREDVGVVSSLSGTSMIWWELRGLEGIWCCKKLSFLSLLKSRRSAAGILRQLPLSSLQACGRYVYGEKNPIGKDEPLLLEESHRL
jgi:hypothetical protein